jgi:hypothetical protein
LTGIFLPELITWSLVAISCVSGRIHLAWARRAKQMSAIHGSSRELDQTVRRDIRE